MLCEWRFGDKAYICLAEYPPLMIENMKASMVLGGAQQEGWVPPESPEQLLERIPMAVPVSSALIPLDGHPGCYAYDPEVLGNIPKMDWGQYFEMGRQAAAGEWVPEPGRRQIPAVLPPPDTIPRSLIPEIEEFGGFKVPALIYDQK